MTLYLASQLSEDTTLMEQWLTYAVHAVEMIGAILIIISVVIGLIEVGWATLRSRIRDAVTSVRFRLAQRMVLALEFLIAADILKTITTPTLEGMAVLGGIIAIRTVLSLSIAYELKRAHLMEESTTQSIEEGTEQREQARS